MIANEIVDEKRHLGEEEVVFKIGFLKVLVNANAKGWVKATRGLRQGDPLSPFLFTIVTDVLNDTIFFSRAHVEELRTLKIILLVFGQISGLKVNLDKSTLCSINLDQDYLTRLVTLSIYETHTNGWDANTIVKWLHRCPKKAIAQVFQDFTRSDYLTIATTRPETLFGDTAIAVHPQDIVSFSHVFPGIFAY
ncbi:hypothetical protein CK203_079795 [Vitis vinifera]|uniref:Uncharacterized protein n=1 Tax=Vitis vinifera TaxID=29760 RepID=A0A438DHT2_VITVI|nr:hypothetical protein CK203_079795 [Vitis vinifera]